MSFGKRNIPVNAPEVDWQQNDAVTTRVVSTREARKLRQHLAQLAADNNTAIARFKRWLNSDVRI